MRRPPRRLPVPAGARRQRGVVYFDLKGEAAPAGASPNADMEASLRHFIQENSEPFLDGIQGVARVLDGVVERIGGEEKGGRILADVVLIAMASASLLRLRDEQRAVAMRVGEWIGRMIVKAREGEKKGAGKSGAGDAKAEPAAPVEKCDFCSSPEVRWCYPAQSFESGAFGKSLGDWAACDACREVIERGDREALVACSLGEAANGFVGLPGEVREKMRTALRELHAKFFSHRTGPAVPVESHEPPTPARP